MLESIRCNTCSHCHVCHAVAECTNTLYPCNDYEKNRSHGMWIPTDEIGNVVRCSECNYETCEDISEEFKFCPKCGSKNVGDV